MDPVAFSMVTTIKDRWTGERKGDVRFLGRTAIAIRILQPQKIATNLFKNIYFWLH